MRTRWLAITICVGVLVTACGPPAGRTTDLGVPGPPDLLVLTSSSGLSVLDARTGSIREFGPGLPAVIEPDNVVTSSKIAGGTLIAARDAATGKVDAAVEAPPGLIPRVVSSDGWEVVMMEPPPDGVDPWVPQPRSETSIVLVDLKWGGRTTPYRLKGNFDPEAFLRDGRTLFLLEYLPPEDPAAYRVVRMDLDDGEIDRVYGVGTKPTPVETMSGTRLSQTASADGSRLYTLYTTQPPEYAGAAHAADEAVAFVHTLDLEDGWAHCIALPERFWGGDPAHQAMAASADGRLLYVVDVGRDLVTVVDTTRLKAIRTVIADLGGPGGRQARALVSPDGEALFVATGNRLVSLSTADLESRATWTLDAPASGLGFSLDGSRLYVATERGVVALDPSTGRTLQRIATGGPMELIGALEA